MQQKGCFYYNPGCDQMFIEPIQWDVSSLVNSFFIIFRLFFLKKRL